MHIYPSSAEYGLIHADTVRYWMVHVCTGGAHRYMSIHGTTSGNLFSALCYHWMYYVTSIMHSITASCTTLPLLCTLLPLVVCYLYYELCYCSLYVTSIMHSGTAGCMFSVLHCQQGRQGPCPHPCSPVSRVPQLLRVLPMPL
jgi:hypothetical protein